MTRRRVVLLDRDGTINAEREYLSDPEGVALLPGAAEGLRLLHELGLGLVVVTNQAGVGRGYYTMAQAQAVSDRLAHLLGEEGITLDGVYMCPHAPDAGCACRKPATGMVEQASRDLGFDPAEGFLVGDKAIDVAMGRRVGATTILVRTGYGAEQEAEAGNDTDHVADNLLAAARIIGSVLDGKEPESARG